MSKRLDAVEQKVVDLIAHYIGFDGYKPDAQDDSILVGPEEIEGAARAVMQYMRAEIFD